MITGFMTPKEAAVALVSHYTGRGPVNGSFATKLIEAFEKADPVNTLRLLNGFPEFTAPLRFLNTQGVEELEKKVEAGFFH